MRITKREPSRLSLFVSGKIAKIDGLRKCAAALWQYKLFHWLLFWSGVHWAVLSTVTLEIIIGRECLCCSVETSGVIVAEVRTKITRDLADHGFNFVV